MKAGLLQEIKSALVRKGPDSELVRIALAAHAKTRGFKIFRKGENIHLCRGTLEIVLSKSQYVQIPAMEDSFDLWFDAVKAQVVGDRSILDFSAPAIHEYVRSGESFLFPSVPEDDVMEAYTRRYAPKHGDVVWDVGAHAGATTFFLSKMVGPRGRVFAFEPDRKNIFYLGKNIERHGLSNVVIVQKALSGNTGTATFSMDGSMSAGITEFLVYTGDPSTRTEVQTITMEDACKEFGSVPAYIKMDIEGAEAPAVEASVQFLRSHPIHFAIESHRLEDGDYTHTSMGQSFEKCGYSMEASAHRGQFFAWAKPVD